MNDRPPRAARLIRLDAVKPEPIRWMLPGRVPFGALTILGGRPGEGKSTLTLNLASQLSHSSGTIIIGAEDGLADTVAPRLIASGANLANVHAMDVLTDRGFEDGAVLPTDVPLLEREVRETSSSLVIVDPFAAHLDPDLNSSNDHSLRQALRPLARMAHDTGAAVIVVAHLRKSRDGGPMDWIGGSGGLTGAARSVLLFGRHKDEEPLDDDYRYLCNVKLNGARLGATVRCRLEGCRVKHGGRMIPTSRVLIEEEQPSVSARDLA